MIEKGLKGVAEIICNDKNTAIAMESGSLQIFSTPSMVALMEKASVNAIEKYLEDGQTTVGTFLQIEHISATPCGMKITAESEVTDINGREIIFSVTARDEKDIIGKGIHKRFTVNAEKFMNRTNSK